jgi:hypothetical protein
MQTAKERRNIMKPFSIVPVDAGAARAFGAFKDALRISRPVLAAVAVAATFTVADCSDDGTAAIVPNRGQSGIILGETKPLGAANAYSWVQTGAHGDVTAFGLSFGEAALTKLGSTPAEIVLALPPAPNLRVRTAVINWNPQGHPPAHVYDVPHFDFHFYTIDEATRMAIAPVGPAAAATPAPNLVPAGFRTDGATIPMMGMHFISAAAPEFNGGKFTATPIYGYANGHLAFVESMITLDYLRARPGLSATLPVPAHFEQSGLYPTQWTAKYDATAHRYDIAFSGLTYR